MKGSESEPFGATHRLVLLLPAQHLEALFPVGDVSTLLSDIQREQERGYHVARDDLWRADLVASETGRSKGRLGIVLSERHFEAAVANFGILTGVRVLHELVAVGDNSAGFDDADAGHIVPGSNISHGVGSRVMGVRVVRGYVGVEV